MSKHHLRKDKNCENCGHFVEERFCSHCGQENVETRQTFGHLVRHFMEDLTHYESNFWKTIKYLLFRPSYLTKTYLEGKRMSYVAPVKLYIFISFVAFFLPGITPDFNSDSNHKVGNTLKQVGDEMTAFGDSLNRKNATNIEIADTISAASTGPKTVRAYDSIQNSLPQSKRDPWFQSFISRRVISYSNMSNEERNQVADKIKHNFPKALFIYLPIFAFTVWMFHGKKKWYFFDHAIFTLHYFSFLLLLISLLGLLNNLIPWHFIISPFTIAILCLVGGWFWSVHYFYRGHRKFYGESWGISWLKSGFIIFLNSIMFILLVLGLFTVSIWALH